MQLTLTGHHVDITESLRAYVQEKFSRLERHFDQVLDVHVILTVEKLRHKAEASLHVSGNKIYADAVEEDMYVALDGLIDKIDRQVVKHKEKLKNHHRNRNEGAHRHHSPEDLELQADEI
ncbi:MAG TPA: ribosome-associated translation inhibitor RaiA [Gammaproteobacteria bacterium]|nr:ribosome-associated translation inhibitor RaiA [Gammaproteobacteria bacterium]